jgi:hypothetical protein
MGSFFMNKSLIDNIMRIIITINYGVASGIICAIINITIGFGASVFMCLFLTGCFHIYIGYYWG